jgi:hypothetical protein
MGAFMTALAERNGIASQALRFVILTAARTDEVVQAVGLAPPHGGRNDNRHEW